MPRPAVRNAAHTGSVPTHVLPRYRSPVRIHASLADTREIAGIAGSGAAGAFLDTFVGRAGFEVAAGRVAGWGVTSGGVVAAGIEVEGLLDVDLAEGAGKEGAGHGVGWLGRGIRGRETRVDVFEVDVAGVGAVVAGEALARTGRLMDGGG